MLINLNRMSKNQKIIFSIDCILIVISMSMYFLYTQFELFGLGIAFVIVGLLQIIIRVVCSYLMNMKFGKLLWVSKDFILIVFVSFIASLVILTTNSFSLEYGKYIIFNILFLLYMSFQLCFDLIMGKDDG